MGKLAATRQWETGLHSGSGKPNKHTARIRTTKAHGSARFGVGRFVGLGLRISGPSYSTSWPAIRRLRPVSSAISISLTPNEANHLRQDVQLQTNHDSPFYIAPLGFSLLASRSPMPIQLTLFGQLQRWIPPPGLHSGSLTLFRQHENNHEPGVSVVRTAPLRLTRYGLWSSDFSPKSQWRPVHGQARLHLVAVLSNQGVMAVLN